MPPQVSDQDLGLAVLQSLEHGSFPQSEHVASAPVSSTALPKLLKALGKAREDKKNEIRQASRQSASDVDGWIAQAHKLQDDIKRSQQTAREIVRQAESGKKTTARVHDAASQVSFLYSEIEYNESLAQMIEQLRDISTLLDAAQDAAVRGHAIHALERLEHVDDTCKALGPFENTRVVGVLKTRAEQLRSAIVETTTESWNGLIVVDSTERRVSFKDTIESEASVHIDTVVEALTKLDLLDGFIARLSREFDHIIISARLDISSDQIVSAFEVEGDDIQIKGHVNDLGVHATLEDIQAIADYLSTRLPPSIAIPLSAKLLPTITNRLITYWLMPAVPISTERWQDFQEILSLVLELAESFDELDWSGQGRLREWVDKAAEIWLAKQKEVSITRVHRSLPRRASEKKIVERAETQMVSRGDAMLSGQEDQEEDWGAEWGEEEQPTQQEQELKTQDAEEEDMSAWDDDGEEPQEEIEANDMLNDQHEEEEEEEEEEDPDAWGWGDEEEEPPAEAPATQTRSNGQPTLPHKPTAEKEITLRETYTVTAIPDSIINIIKQVASDVRTLNQPDLVHSAIAPASTGLYAIPGLLLAMYRATAASHYSKDVAGNMLAYNDCIRLSDNLRTFFQEQVDMDKSSTLPRLLRPSVRLTLDDDIKAIEGFGKRAYGREMESQRTVIRDHLEGAQGFQSCTNAPFAAECDNAIAMTIDRIEEVKRQWQGVLSHSALLQSLGSLVSAALTKFIGDVEDMSDIAEDESKKLHSYCTSLSSLSSLFQTNNDSGEPQDMTGIYTPNWFKFQYLSEILDSSLADIKYFWTDGELRLEMEAEEVVDLIKALFAESEHRRKAIGEIRGSSITR